MANTQNKKTDEDLVPPLERLKVKGGDNEVGEDIPALSKCWAPPEGSRKWVAFYLPSSAAERDEILEWEKRMEILSSDLKWLLSLPHHKFWSCMVHSPSINRVTLSSFLQKAPRFYDPYYEAYKSRTRIWGRYKELYLLYFRVFLRLSTYKESKEHHITPSVWSKLLRDHDLLSLSVLQNLCTLYESSENPIFAKMVENVMKQDNVKMKELLELVEIMGDKFLSLGEQTQELINAENWDEAAFEDILWFTMDALFSFLKLVKAYHPAAQELLHYRNFLYKMAVAYEVNAHRWGTICAHLPSLERCANLCKIATLRLFRVVLVTPTIEVVESANDKRLDDFFTFFSDCIDEKVFIHDYEKMYPFRADMQALLSRGIFVDETRIDYMANAISSCFHSCGEEYSVEKIVVDPLYDPNFDRQLLGACSLDIGGVELESLVTQVKDILPEMPNSYVEAVLKHYGYQTEAAIHALLEGSVPSRLEKYKSEEYIRSQQVTPVPPIPLDLDPDQLPVATSSLPETFLPSKQHRTEQEVKMDDETKRKIHMFLDMEDNERRRDEEGYVDRNLLPPQFVHGNDEYDDEYDDTYDDVGAGLREPDADRELFKPLNTRKAEMANNAGDDEEEYEQQPSSSNGGGQAFCEDPAIIRAKLERKREEDFRRRNPHHQPPQSRDVVGRTKGQGQEKDVLYNRRQKNVHKGGGGNFKKRADFKRKEF